MSRDKDKPFWVRILEKIQVEGFPTLEDKLMIANLRLVPFHEFPDDLISKHWIWTGANTNPKMQPACRIVRDADGLPFRTFVDVRQRGVFHDPGLNRTISAQLAVYEATRGKLPPLKRLKQQCDVDLCVNCTHWKPVDAKERKAYRTRIEYKPDPNSDMLELMELIESRCATKTYSGLDELASGLTSYTKTEIAEAAAAIGGAVALQILGARAS